MSKGRRDDARSLDQTQEDAGEARGLLSEQIRNALTDEIASGSLSPGMVLDEQQLADRFGVSRTPVREALRQLSAGGLVEVRPRRGVAVARMTPERVMDMFETTAEIEALCVRLAAHRMTPLEFSHLLEAHEASKAMVENGDLDAYDAYNRVFHEMIYTATHNAFLAEQAMALRVRLRGYRRMQLRRGDRIIRSREEHDRILMAIAQGNGEEAGRQMRAHMLNAASALRHYVRTQTLAVNQG
jgi:DNA-binding GntR family transcriptional regulator